ncbi:MAG: NAD-dependent epimerase/dehydratase family protein [Butyrivibrio sp.]|uniref:NAD-dependent epimerase/dehydratase family protein n=1 Tax=Butyrivibrio sp. TaxID=28121 RepID=UPI0025FBD8B3|nr:NAD-dependent epimerase/dehydratase family protein [Butyrivibrio sp.]MCR5771013.1 NAD-dependent epimerase/dehydratase family protein [Butyrivibrio sp.]
MKTIDASKTYLVTGAAGFIGYHLSKRLIEAGAKVIGFDNMNDYYPVALKEERLRLLGIAIEEAKASGKNASFTFVKGDLKNKDDVDNVFNEYKPDIVMNLAAQAGVRYSIDNPGSYIESNLIGFFNILEACRHSYDNTADGYKGVEHLVYASSSSVYGGNTKVPFSTEDKVDEPVSLYAATKKSNELMAHAYSKLYGIPATGLRFFTVYGPLGRPDMALFKFTDKIMAGKPIQIYNNGDMKRDFTYIDDIVTGIINILPNAPKDNGKGARYKVYNIGNNHPEPLMDMVTFLEQALGITANKEFLPMQAGDVYQTYADVTELERDFGFKPATPLKDGIESFVRWYKEYYKA